MAQEGVQYVIETDISDALSDFQTLGAQLKKVETNIENSKTDFVKLGDTLDNSGKHVDNFENHVKHIPASTKIAKTGIDGLIDGMKKLVTIGAIVGTTKKVIDIYGDFENQMNAVEAVSGATGEEMKSLSDLAAKLGADTNYSATEAGAAEEALLRLGNSANSTKTMVGEVLNFDRANKVGDLAKSSEILSSELKMFAMNASEATRVADAMAMTTKNSKTTVEYLSSAFNNAGADAKNLGYDIEDTLTLVGAMSTNFADGSSAGTALKGMFADLSKNADKFNKFLKVDVADKNGHFRQVEDIINDINKSLSSKTPLEQQKLLNACFGETGKAAYNALSAAGGSIDGLEKKIRNASGTTKTMAAIMDSGLKPKIDGMMGSIETLAITVGEKLNPYFLKTIGASTELINKTSDMITNWENFYTKNQELIDSFAIVSTAVLAYVGITKTMAFWDGVVLASKEAGTVANFLYTTSLGMNIAFMEAGAGATGILTAAQWGLNAAYAANPVGFVITGVALLNIGVREGIKHFQGFRSAIEWVVNGNPISKWINDTIERFDWLSEKVDGFKEGVSWLWGWKGVDEQNYLPKSTVLTNNPIDNKYDLNQKLGKTDVFNFTKTDTKGLVNTNLYPQNKINVNPKSVPTTTTTKNNKTEVKTNITNHIVIQESNKLNIDELTNKISKKVTNNISSSFLDAAKLAGVN